MRGAPAGRFQWYAGSGIGARGMDLRRFLRRGVPYSIIRYIAPDARRMSVMAVLRPGAESGRFSPIYPSDLLRRIARSVPGGGLAVHCGTRFSSRPVFPRYISKCPEIPEKGRCRSISYPARSPRRRRRICRFRSLRIAAWHQVSRPAPVPGRRVSRLPI
jgi:hypothetical protein